MRSERKIHAFEARGVDQEDEVPLPHARFISRGAAAYRKSHGEFFAYLAVQGLFGAFARLLLAAGKLPEAAMSGRGRAAREKDPPPAFSIFDKGLAISILNDGGHDRDGRKIA
jgi:hypothetical protein